jgi:hypothetical protein
MRETFANKRWEQICNASEVHNLVDKEGAGCLKTQLVKSLKRYD